MYIIMCILLGLALIYQLFKSALMLICLQDILKRLKGGNESWVNDFIIQSQVDDGVSFANAKMIDLEHRQWRKLGKFRKANKIMSLSGISIMSSIITWAITDTILYNLILYFS